MKIRRYLVKTLYYLQFKRYYLPVIDPTRWNGGKWYWKTRKSDKKRFECKFLNRLVKIKHWYKYRKYRK